MADLMNPGGGLTKAKLLLANANPSDVSKGKSFYSNGNKELQTGTLVERGMYQNAGGISGGGDGDFFAFNDIPEGIYRKNSTSWAPEIRYSKVLTLDYILNAIAISVNAKALAYNSGRLQTDFSVESGKVYLVIAQAGARDNNPAYTNINIPVSHKTYVFHEQDYTQDQYFMYTSIKIKVFRARANGECWAAGAGNGDRAVAFIGIWRLVP